MNLKNSIKLFLILNFVFSSISLSEELREMSTDRPDTTESPYTVDENHFQLEMSFIDYIKEDSGEEYSITPFNFKYGLTDSLDVQLVVEPQIVRRHTNDKRSNFGDSQIRLKKNLWGNDGGETAFALMPYIQLPTGGNGFSSDHVEWGIILPLGISLSDETNLGLMGEFDFIRNDTDSDYNSEFLHSATIGTTLIGELGGYVEYVGISALDTGDDYQSIFNGGLTYGLSENTQLDCGAGYGLSDSAPDLNLFAGISIRI